MLAKWSAALLERPNTPKWFVLIDCHVCNFLPMFREEWPVEQMWFSTNSWVSRGWQMGTLHTYLGAA